MAIYGYIRVSTNLQTLENQHYEIAKFCEKQKIKIDQYMEEVISSRKKLCERRLGQLLEKLQEGDLLIATEISRLGRNMLEIMGILQLCLEKNCQIWTIKENYKLGADIQSKVLAFAFSLASEIERQLISQRTKECLRRLKAEGKRLGRPLGKIYRKLTKRNNEIEELIRQNTSKAEIARIMNCSWITVHRYITKYKK